MSSIQGKFGPAFIQALILCVVRFFTIPWRIWKGTAFRLAAMREMNDEDRTVDETSEFPVFTWIKTAWDGIIFLSWPVIAVVAFIVLIGGLFTSYAATALGVFLLTLIYGYFSVIMLSLFKESLILLLTIAINVERIMKKGTVNNPNEN